MNIVEGNIRRSPKDKANFLMIAMGSLEELHYQLLLALDLGYLNHEQANNIDASLQKTGYLLTRMRTSIL
jgi:four helix bundle protein